MDHDSLPGRFNHPGDGLWLSNPGRGQKMQSPKHFTKGKNVQKKTTFGKFKKCFHSPCLFFTALRLLDTGCKGLGGDEEDVPEGPCPSCRTEVAGGGQNQSPSVSLALFHAELPAALEESPADIGSGAGELKGDSLVRQLKR